VTKNIIGAWKHTKGLIIKNGVNRTYYIVNVTIQKKNPNYKNHKEVDYYVARD